MLASATGNLVQAYIHNERGLTPIKNNQGIRKTPDKLYSHFLHFHHLHMQRMVRMFQLTEDGHLILWEAHSQAFWDVYSAGIRTTPETSKDCL